MSSTDSNISNFRGGFPKSNLNARKIAGALESPGCQRRSVLEASCVDMNRLASLLTGGQKDRQSPFALTRGVQFEKHVTEGASGMSPVLALVRESFGFSIPEAREKDLSADKVREEYPGLSSKKLIKLRAKLTRQIVKKMLSSPNSAINLLRHAVTTLSYGGEVAYLEQDVLAFSVRGRLYVVEIKSFPKIDGRADPEKSSQALRQTAVYVLSLQELVVSMGYDSSAVETDCLIVLPDNLSFNPTGTLVQTSFQVERLRRQLAEVPNVNTILSNLNSALPDPKSEDAAVVASNALADISPRFGDSCIRCPLFKHCKREAENHKSISRLGNMVANNCGSIRTVDEALDLAYGNREPANDGEAAIAKILRNGSDVLSWIS